MPKCAICQNKEVLLNTEEFHSPGIECTFRMKTTTSDFSSQVSAVIETKIPFQIVFKIRKNEYE